MNLNQNEQRLMSGAKTYHFPTAISVGLAVYRAVLAVAASVLAVYSVCISLIQRCFRLITGAYQLYS